MAIRLSGMASGLDTEAMVQELVSSYNIKKESFEKEQTRQEWKIEKWKDLNAKIYKFYTGSLSSMKLSSTFNKKKTVASDTNKASVIAASNAVTGTQSLVIKKLASSGYLTGAEIAKKDGEKVALDTKLSEIGLSNEESIKVKMGDGTSETVVIKPDMTISDLVKEFKNAGLNASFDVNNQRFFLSSSESGEAANFDLEGDSGLLSKLGLNYGVDADGDGKSDNTTGAIKLAGKDAEIELNGATFKSKSNTFSVNGLTIEAKELSDFTVDDDGNKTYSATTLSTSMDVDAVYDMVKGFLKEYNALIKELDTVYSADSSKGYDPLTSEEKEAMTEEDIEKWETKIKDSLLRRDGTVSSITSMLKNIMASTYTLENGKTYSLSSFGIGTLGYFTAGENEKGVYHIDGDAEDDATAGNDDKLKTMIASDPEAVTEFFKKLGTDLYNNVNKKMQSTTLSSAFTVYNDKQMDSELKEIKKKITDWEAYVKEQEDYWYKKFSAMEKALSELQSSTSAISGLLGTGQ